MPDFTELFKKLLDFETSINAGKLDINEIFWTSSDLIWADTVSANEPSQTLQNHDLGAEIPGVSAGLQVPPQPLRPPRAPKSVSKALPSHSDPTCVASG
jgi:hypothetical protein